MKKTGLIVRGAQWSQALKMERSVLETTWHNVRNRNRCKISYGRMCRICICLNLVLLRRLQVTQDICLCVVFCPCSGDHYGYQFTIYTPCICSDQDDIALILCHIYPFRLSFDRWFDLCASPFTLSFCCCLKNTHHYSYQRWHFIFSLSWQIAFRQSNHSGYNNVLFCLTHFNLMVSCPVIELLRHHYWPYVVDKLHPPRCTSIQMYKVWAQQGFTLPHQDESRELQSGLNQIGKGSWLGV